jgi:hypothetical protein
MTAQNYLHPDHKEKVEIFGVFRLQVINGLENLPLSQYLAGATILQLIHIFLIVLIRPFEKVKDNIIEIVNEVGFTLLMGGIIHFKEKSIWNRTAISVYIYLMIFPALFIIFISICKCSAY